MENGKFKSISIKINKNNETEKFKNSFIFPWYRYK